MNNEMKRSFRIFVLKILAVVFVLTMCYFLYAFVYRARTELPTKAVVTNRASAVYTLRGQMQMLSQKEAFSDFLRQLQTAMQKLDKQLFVCVPPEHELARQKELTFEKINGFNFLLRTELGFWDTMCREKMPASKFLVQTDTEAFNELVRASSLPCFITDYIQEKEMEDYGRIRIPITDPEAKVTFYVKELS